MMKGGGGPRRSDHPEASLPLYVSCPSCFTADNMSLAITQRERERDREREKERNHCSHSTFLNIIITIRLVLRTNEYGYCIIFFRFIIILTLVRS